MGTTKLRFLTSCEYRFPVRQRGLISAYRNQSWYQFNDEVVTHIGTLGAKVKPTDVIEITEEGAVK